MATGSMLNIMQIPTLLFTMDSSASSLLRLPRDMGTGNVLEDMEDQDYR